MKALFATILELVAAAFLAVESRGMEDGTYDTTYQANGPIDKSRSQRRQKAHQGGVQP
jgi:hypothetical protein